MNTAQPQSSGKPAPNTSPSPSSSPATPPQHRPARRPFALVRLLLRACLWLGLLSSVLLVLVLGFIRTEYGANSVRTVAVSVFEWFDIVGLKLEIDSLSGPLPNHLHAQGVRMRDSEGVWLTVDSVHAELDIASTLQALLHGQLLVHGRLAAVRGAHMMRIPNIPSEPEEQPSTETSIPEPFTLLPSWLVIQVDKAELYDLETAPEVSALGLAGHVQGSLRLEAARAYALLGLALAPPENKAYLPKTVSPFVPQDIAKQWPFPASEALHKQIAPVQEESAPATTPAAERAAATAQPATAAQPEPAREPAAPTGTAQPPAQAVQGIATGSLRLLWEGTRYGLQADINDAAFTPSAVPLAEQAQIHLDAHYILPLVPPVPTQGMRLEARATVQAFGAALPAAGRQMQAHFLGSYDGQSLLLGPVRLSSADKGAEFTLLGAGGYADQGQGFALSGKAQELASFFALFTTQKETALAGKATLCAYMGKGRDWWHEALDGADEPAEAAQSCLRRGANVQGKNTADKQRILLELTSPSLHVGKEIISDIHLQGSATGTGQAPFSPLLPASLEGSVQVQSKNLLQAGAVSVHSRYSLQWDTAGQALLNIHELKASLPGIQVQGNAAIQGYTEQGLPLLQGEVRSTITDWSTLARLGNYAMQGKASSLHVRANTKGMVQDLDFSAQLEGFSSPDARISSLRLEAQGKDIYSLLQGKTKQSGSLNAKLHMGESDLAGTAWQQATGQIQSQGENAQGSISAQGIVNVQVQANYSFSKHSLAITQCDILHEDKLLGKAGLRLSQTALIDFTDGLRVHNVRVVALPKGSLHLDALFSEKNLSLKATLSELPLQSLRRIVGNVLPDGDLNASAQLHGTAQSPAGTLKLSVENIRQPRVGTLPLAGELPQSISINGVLARGNKGHALKLQADIAGLSKRVGDSFTATAHLPLRFSPAPALDMHSAAALDIFWRGDAQSLWHYIPLPGRNLQGRVQAEMHMAGSLAQPRIKAAAYLGKGVYTDLLLGVKLQDIMLESRYDSRGDSLLRLSAGDTRGGRLIINGTVLRAPQAKGLFDMEHLRVKASGFIDNLRPLHRDDVKATLSGVVGLEGALVQPHITGSLTLQEVFYTIKDFGAPSVTTLDNVYTVASREEWKTTCPKPNTSIAVNGPTLDVQVQAPGKIFIRGKGLSSEWKTKLHISGALARPDIVGDVQPVRGTFDILGKEFTFKRGAITFSGAWPPVPSLDLGLDYAAQNIIAEIMVHGSATKPRLDLSSKPSMPRDEVMAQILFDKNANDLNRFQLLQAANAARQLVEGGLGALDILDKTRDLLGFEVLRLGNSSSGAVKKRAPQDASLQSSAESESESSPTLEAGKYLFDNVYVGVEQGTGAQGDTAVRVDIDVLPNVSVTGRTSSQSSSVGANWKMDY
jgi:autotransporter translocation and assembly factor TamB